MDTAVKTAKKTLVLVFPPLTLPTSPPLGIAMLKGYIERELPDWDVKLLDLNLWALNKILSGVESGTRDLGESVYAEDRCFQRRIAPGCQGLSGIG